AASKHALRALANGLRVEEEGHGVRVSTVYPGPTDTPMFDGDVDRAALIRPASVAAAVVMAITASDDVQLTDIHVRPRRELSWCGGKGPDLRPGALGSAALRRRRAPRAPRRGSRRCRAGA